MNNSTDQHAEWFSYWFNSILDNIEQVIKGKRDQIATALVCLFAEGHLLLEDVPGTGKTASGFSRSIGTLIPGALTPGRGAGLSWTANAASKSAEQIFTISTVHNIS